MNILTKKPKQVEIKSNLTISLYDPGTHMPKQCTEEPAFSEEVCTIDENGMYGVAFFAFEDNKWVFHVDTLIDYNSEGIGIKWKWYYPPLNSNEIKW